MLAMRGEGTGPISGGCKIKVTQQTGQKPNGVCE